MAIDIIVGKGDDMFQNEFQERFKSIVDQSKKNIARANNNHRLYLQDLPILEREINQNNLSWNIPVNETITSHRKLIGPFIVYFKKVVRKLLKWFVTTPLLQQREFNASVTRSLNELYKFNRSFNDFYGDHIENLNKLHKLLGEIQSIEGVKVRLSTIEQDMQRKEFEEDFNINYLKFEDQFRGTESNIERDQLAVYLPYLQERNKVLDIGCGRGELISALKEKGYVTTGIDFNENMIEHCKTKGLNVYQQDASSFLKETNERFDAIFSLHVVEHLKPGQIIEITKQAYGSLNEGGILIIETPNPECLYNLAYGFTIDMTHVKLVHAYTLKFIVEEMGFKDVKIKHLKPVDEQLCLSYINEAENRSQVIFNDNMKKINTLLYSYQNYAIIATK